jgi:hypothetical protein
MSAILAIIVFSMRVWGMVFIAVIVAMSTLSLLQNHQEERDIFSFVAREAGSVVESRIH